jgi:hypothetical protein
LLQIKEIIPQDVQDHKIFISDKDLDEENTVEKILLLKTKNNYDAITFCKNIPLLYEESRLKHLPQSLNILQHNMNVSGQMAFSTIVSAIGRDLHITHQNTKHKFSLTNYLVNDHLMFDGLNKNNVLFLISNHPASSSNQSRFRFYLFYLVTLKRHASSHIIAMSNFIKGNVTALALKQDSNKFCLTTSHDNKNYFHLYSFNVHIPQYSSKNIMNKKVKLSLPITMNSINFLTKSLLLSLGNNGMLYKITRQSKKKWRVQPITIRNKEGLVEKIDLITINPMAPYLIFFTTKQGRLCFVNLKNSLSGIRFYEINDTIEAKKMWFYGDYLFWQKNYTQKERVGAIQMTTIKVLKIFLYHDTWQRI